MEEVKSEVIGVETDGEIVHDNLLGEDVKHEVVINKTDGDENGGAKRNDEESHANDVFKV